MDYIKWITKQVGEKGMTLMEDLNKKMLEQLHDGVKYALGCTEPVAVALAVATASKKLDGDIISINVVTSPNIYKNGMGVGIPGTDMVGLNYATTLGAVCGDPSLGLEVLDPVNEECIKEAEELLKEEHKDFSKYIS